jgi:hypothetical protein
VRSWDVLLCFALLILPSSTHKCCFCFEFVLIVVAFYLYFYGEYRPDLACGLPHDFKSTTTHEKLSVDPHDFA